jgi:hypothetical protein
MTHKIMSSQVPPNFEVAVSAHALEMRNWKAHMARVDEDKKNNVPLDKAHMAYPRPVASPLVVASINEKLEPDFIVVPDELPREEPRDETIDAKKAGLVLQISRAEQNMIEAISPTNKRRLLDMQEADVRKSDAARVASVSTRYREILAQYTATNVALRKNPNDPKLTSDAESLEAEFHVLTAQLVDPENTIHKDRPAADKKLLDDQKSRRDKIAIIQRWAAQNHSDIDDLTIETIDTWKFPSLPDIK